MREEGQRPGKKVRNAGFMRPPFAIGPSSRSRRMGAPSAIDRETDGAGITAYVTGGGGPREGPLASNVPRKRSNRRHCQRIGRTARCQTSRPNREWSVIRQRLEPGREAERGTASSLFVRYPRRTLRDPPSRIAGEGQDDPDFGCRDPQSRASPSGSASAPVGAGAIFLVVMTRGRRSRPSRSGERAAPACRRFQDTSDLMRAVLSLSRPPPPLV